MKKMSGRTWMVMGVVVLAVVFSGAVRAEETVALKLELPQPMFVGTPKNIKSANLERPRKAGEPRPEFLVPVGVTNVAKGKPVTGSDSLPVIGEMELVTDGDKEGSDGSYVEFGPGMQYVQIDLGAEYDVYAVVVWHYHAQGTVYRDVVVQFGQDADMITGVETVFNNDHDNSSGQGIGRDKEYIESYEGRLIDTKGKKARYVRLYSNGSTSSEMNHYIEVEVYGKPTA